ncbi:50S ribosomal protein L18 [Candidatus Saccharibacteria bacterium]|nr:50S ribosomal protein L18 [Candidatus Saccharibacteria bacterium]
MNRLDHKQNNLKIRKNRVRSTVSGTEERPRLSVHISNRNVSAQIINDVTGNTLVSASTTHTKASTGTLSDKCALVGAEIAKKATKAKITKVVLDRNGRLYEKRLSTFADAARENGLEF